MAVLQGAEWSGVDGEVLPFFNVQFVGPESNARELGALVPDWG